MVLYEIVLTVDAKAPGPKILEILQKAARLVLSRSGNVRKLQNWGERELAYKVRRNEQNHTNARFISMWIDAHPVVLKEVEASMRYNKEILRQMTFRRKFKLPEGDGFLSKEIREAAARAA